MTATISAQDVFDGLVAQHGGLGALSQFHILVIRQIVKAFAEAERTSSPVEAMRAAEIAARLAGMLPKPTASEPGAALDLKLLSDDQLTEFEKLMAIASGQTPPTPQPVAPVAMGAHRPGRPDCSCSVCSPGEMGETLVTLRSEVAALKDALYRAAQRGSASADVAGHVAHPAANAAPTPAANAAPAMPHAPVANVVPLTKTRDQILAECRPVHREEPWESFVRGGPLGGGPMKLGSDWADRRT